MACAWVMQQQQSLHDGAPASFVHGHPALSWQSGDSVPADGAYAPHGGGGMGEGGKYEDGQVRAYVLRMWRAPDEARGSGLFEECKCLGEAAAAAAAGPRLIRQTDARG